jgi:uncharacterized protein (DUF433 family)
MQLENFFESKSENQQTKGRNGTKLKQEMYGGELYEYYPLGKHIVAAPGVCGGRPTFKYTRLEASMILSLLATGDSISELVHAYSESNLTPEAVGEAIRLANQALLRSTSKLQTVGA